MTPISCAIYTRKSSEEGLEQGFNSLDAQREACEAFILSQKTQGWRLVPTTYDDGGFSGGNIERPGLQRLMDDVQAKRVQIVVVYKVDRLTRSLADFAKLVEIFDAQGASFVSVTQQFNTTSSMGRLTLNVLLSFAQFEREVTGERIRDKIAASKRKGMWMGGIPPIGYCSHERTLAIDETQAPRIREIYRLYLQFGCVRRLKEELHNRGWLTTPRTTRAGEQGNLPFSRGHLYRILANPVYLGKIVHKDQVFEGQHPALIDQELWEAVQERLAENQNGVRRQTNAAEPSLLAGLVFDTKGVRFTPSHAKKGAKRYRYYVRAPSESGEAPEDKAIRIPAHELESAVIETVFSFLTSQEQLMELVDSSEAVGIERMLAQARALGKELASEATAKNGIKNSAKSIQRLRRLVEKVVVRDADLVVTVRLHAIWPAMEARMHTLVVAARLKRCGLAVRLVVWAPHQPPPPQKDPTLIAMLNKAHDWFGRLTVSGHSIQQIAEAEQVTGSYVTRVVHLAFLAPDLVQSILRGEQPEAVSSSRLFQTIPLPACWNAQRRLFASLS